ncbi:hypothetical protein [Actinoplanes sp. NPDC049265]|uniref:hypothetical protein n=1 Tax=Actinoplanes sp. NPDC049265 TaxID=3363902 RepID=UPI00371ED712
MTAGRVDLLVVTASPEEHDAVRDAATGVRWRPESVDGLSCLIGGEVALARPDQPIGPFAARLDPRCVAMAGVCAGDPDQTVPGDVVIADRVHEYDEGKQRATYLDGDHEQHLQDDRWAQAARRFTPEALPSWAAAGAQEARDWLLERLARGDDPLAQVARGRYFPPGTWRGRLDQLVREGLVRPGHRGHELTAAGEAYDRERRAADTGPPRRLPFAVHVGPVAGGRTAPAGPAIWERPRRTGVNGIAALATGAAAVAAAAREHGIPHWFVVAGVLDPAEPERYRTFAARAAAEVLWALLPQLDSA